MFVAIKESFQTSARGEVKVVKEGQTITPAQYRKLNEYSKAKFVEVAKVAKVKVSKLSELERLGQQILDELRVEAQVAGCEVDYSKYSNVVVGWGKEVTDPNSF